MLPLMSKTSPTATGSSSIEKCVMVCSTRSSSTRKCSFSSPVTGRFWGSHTETGTSTRLVSMRRLAEGLDSAGGGPSFGRGSVFTCPRKAIGNRAANVAARVRIRREPDIDGLGVYCTPRQSRRTDRRPARNQKACSLFAGAYLLSAPIRLEWEVSRGLAECIAQWKSCMDRNDDEGLIRAIIERVIAAFRSDLRVH